MNVKKIEASLTYSIRHQVLRPNQELENCKYPLDFEEETIHIGAFMENKLISIASFFMENNSEFKVEVQYRLRGMATLPEYRNREAGSSLIIEAEKLMINKNVGLWWCNARTNVNEYYSKLGMKISGEIFDIDPIGPHVLMYKHISQLSI